MSPLHENKTSILCVDDEEIPRTLRRLILEKQGYHVVTAPSAQQALDILASTPGSPSFDLVLTDQMMPGMSGTELTRRVKSAFPRMPVIIISGMNELPPDAELADRFISKIEGPAALFQGISEVLARYQTA